MTHSIYLAQINVSQYGSAILWFLVNVALIWMFIFGIYSAYCTINVIPERVFFIGISITSLILWLFFIGVLV